MTRRILIAVLACSLLLCQDSAVAAELPKLTSLSDSSLRYSVPEKPYAVLRRRDVEAVIVDNRAVSDDVLPNHRAGYSGVAKLTHAKRKENLFVPPYAGMNFEHIHDGTVQDRKILFEPRHAPMQLRVVDKHTVELYQAPSPHYGLESCLRYAMLEDGTIEMTLECIPRRKTFSNGYIGLFWASYIHQPESLDIHFRGHDDGGKVASRWIRGVTPGHGVLSTHVASTDSRTFVHDPDFSLMRKLEPTRTAHGLAVNPDLSLIDFFKSGNGPQNRGLSRSARTEDASDPSGFQIEAEAV